MSRCCWSGDWWGLVAHVAHLSRGPAHDDSDDVRISARVRSPATFGTTILLPLDAHDVARRQTGLRSRARARARSFRDGFWSWLAQLHAVIFWFNPLGWWLSATRNAGGNHQRRRGVAARHDPVAYAALLLDFARQPNLRRVAMSVAESNVPERIERLLSRTPPAAALSRFVRWALLPR